jgi:hypothetical protein
MKPSPADYDPYYERYIKLVQGDNILHILLNQSKSTQEFLNTITEHKGNYRYADGKWTVKEVVGHLLDTERIFGYRALRIARGEKRSLPGFDQNEYVTQGNFNSRDLSELILEFKMLRKSNLLLFNSFSDEMITKKGYADECSLSVISILYIIAGHELHHMNILKERYIK